MAYNQRKHKKPLPVPRDFQATKLTHKIVRLEWSAVYSSHEHHRGFCYHIVDENGQIVGKTKDPNVREISIPVVEGQKWTFQLKCVEYSSGSKSQLSDPLSMQIPHSLDNGNGNQEIDIPRNCQLIYDEFLHLSNPLLNNGNNFVYILQWVSPYRFNGEIEYEICHDNRVLGVAKKSPLFFTKQEILKYDPKYNFSIRAIVKQERHYIHESEPNIVKRNLAKEESVLINSPWRINNINDNDDKKDFNNFEIATGNHDYCKNDTIPSNVLNNDNTLFIWAVASLSSKHLPDFILIPIGDPDMNKVESKCVYEDDNGMRILLIVWKTDFLSKLDHYFWFESSKVDKIAISPEARPFGSKRRDAWKINKGDYCSIYEIYKPGINIFRSFLGGNELHKTFPNILKAIDNEMGKHLSFIGAMKSILHFRLKWKSLVETTLSDTFRSQIEKLIHLNDNTKLSWIHIEKWLLYAYWLLHLNTNHHKLQPQHFLYFLNSLIQLIDSGNLRGKTTVFECLHEILGRFIRHYRERILFYILSSYKQCDTKIAQLVYNILLKASRIETFEQLRMDSEMHAKKIMMNENFKQEKNGKESSVDQSDNYTNAIHGSLTGIKAKKEKEQNDLAAKSQKSQSVITRAVSRSIGGASNRDASMNDDAKVREMNERRRNDRLTRNEFSELKKIVRDRNITALTTDSIGNDWNNLYQFLTLYCKLFKRGNRKDIYLCGFRIEEYIIENLLLLLCNQESFDTAIDCIKNNNLSWKLFSRILFENRMKWCFVINLNNENGQECGILDTIRFKDGFNRNNSENRHHLLLDKGFYNIICYENIPFQGRCEIMNEFLMHRSKEPALQSDLSKRELSRWFEVILRLTFKENDNSCQTVDYILNQLSSFYRKRLKFLMNHSLIPVDSHFLGLSNVKQSLKYTFMQINENCYGNAFISKDDKSYCLNKLACKFVDSTIMNGKNLMQYFDNLFLMRFGNTLSWNEEGKKIVLSALKRKEESKINYLMAILMIELQECFYGEQYLLLCLGDDKNEWSNFFCADYALVKMGLHDYVSAFDYINQALKNEPDRPYFALIAINLLSQLRMFERQNAVFNENKLYVSSQDSELLTKCDLQYLQEKKENDDNNDNNDKDNNDSMEHFDVSASFAGYHYANQSKLLSNDYSRMNEIGMNHEKTFLNQRARNVAKWKNEQLIKKEKQVSQNIEKYIVHKRESKHSVEISLIEKDYDLTPTMEDVINRCLFYYQCGIQCMNLKKFNHAKSYYKVIFAIISQIDMKIVLLQCKLILQNSFVIKQEIVKSNQMQKDLLNQAAQDNDNDNENENEQDHHSDSNMSGSHLTDDMD